MQGVASVKGLGVILEYSGATAPAVVHRIGVAAGTFAAHRLFLTSKQHFLKERFERYSTCVVASLTH